MILALWAIAKSTERWILCKDNPMDPKATSCL
jgi:hypothetical protein